MHFIDPLGHFRFKCCSLLQVIVLTGKHMEGTINNNNLLKISSKTIAPEEFDFKLHCAVARTSY
jgi:hypothetical protein